MRNLFKRSWQMVAGGALAVLGFGVLPAMAHDIWVTTEKLDGKTIAIVKYGDVADRDTPDPKKLVALDVLGPAGKQNLRWTVKAGTRDGQPVLISGPFDAPASGAITVSYDNGYWTTPVDGNPDHHEANTSKLLIPDGKPSYWVPKFSKTLLGPGAYRTAMHSELEVVPLKDPFTLKAGESLPVRLDFQGKPLVGAPIAYGDGLELIPDDKMPTVKTNAQGIAMVPISRKGPYLLTADYDGPPMEKTLSDQDEPYASLAFDLGSSADDMKDMPGMKSN